MSQSFQELGVSAPVIRALETAGITHPFAVQGLVLPDALAGLDILAESPTGSGKTLAFSAADRRAHGRLERAARRTRPRADARARDPGRSRHPPAREGQGPARRGRLRRRPDRRADQEGARRSHPRRDARPAARPDGAPRRQAQRRPHPRPRRGRPDARHGLQAAGRPHPSQRPGQPADDALLGHLRRRRRRARPRLHRQGHRTCGPRLPAEAQRGEIDHTFVAVTAEDKLDRLVEQLRGDRGLALVFVRTKHGADKLARKLERQHNIRAVAMHGNLSQSQRERALAQFESGRVSTLVATDVAARGLDVDDITHVINFDPPQGDNDYVHRVGRTGRAGRSGTGVTLVLPDQRGDVGRLADAPRPRQAVRRLRHVGLDAAGRPIGQQRPATPQAPLVPCGPCRSARRIASPTKSPSS